MDPLEALAKKGREDKERQDRALSKHFSRFELKQSGNQLLLASLDGNFGWPVWLLWVVGWPSLLITVGVLANLNATWVHLGWGVMVSGGSALLFLVGRRSHRLAQLRWLERFPYAFDGAAYLALLRAPRGQRSMRVKVSFAEPVPAEKRKLIAEAVVTPVNARGWMGDGKPSTATFQGDALHIASGEMHGHFGSGSQDAERPSHHSNQEFHRWFRLLVDGGMVVVHAQFPIASVEVRF